MGIRVWELSTNIQYPTGTGYPQAYMPAAFAVSVSSRDPGAQIWIPSKLSISYGRWWILNPSKFSRLSWIDTSDLLSDRKVNFSSICKKSFSISINSTLYDITWTSQSFSHILPWRSSFAGNDLMAHISGGSSENSSVLITNTTTVLFGDQLLLWAYSQVFSHHPLTKPTSLILVLTFDLASVKIAEMSIKRHVTYKVVSGIISSFCRLV